MNRSDEPFWWGIRKKWQEHRKRTNESEPPANNQSKPLVQFNFCEFHGFFHRFFGNRHLIEFPTGSGLPLKGAFPGLSGVSLNESNLQSPPKPIPLFWPLCSWQCLSRHVHDLHFRLPSQTSNEIKWMHPRMAIRWHTMLFQQKTAPENRLIKHVRLYRQKDKKERVQWHHCLRKTRGFKILTFERWHTVCCLVCNRKVRTVQGVNRSHCQSASTTPSSNFEPLLKHTVCSNFWIKRATIRQWHGSEREEGKRTASRGKRLKAPF